MCKLFFFFKGRSAGISNADAIFAGTVPHSDNVTEVTNNLIHFFKALLLFKPIFRTFFLAT